MDNNNLSNEVNNNEEHPEWMTCLVGKLSFCPECGQETLLNDGIKAFCTNCGYQK